MGANGWHFKRNRKENHTWAIVCRSGGIRRRNREQLWMHVRPPCSGKGWAFSVCPVGCPVSLRELLSETQWLLKVAWPFSFQSCGLRACMVVRSSSSYSFPRRRNSHDRHRSDQQSLLGRSRPNISSCQSRKFRQRCQRLVFLVRCLRSSYTHTHS